MLGTAVQYAPQEQWLTIAEAAVVLGTSPDTVRRRIRRGELVVERHARPTQTPESHARPGSSRPR
jgi:helix-turn-helix protein